MELVFKTYSNTSIIHKGVYVYFEYIQNVFQIYTQHIKAILQVHPKLLLLNFDCFSFNNDKNEIIIIYYL
jgi:hypothetical protein